MKTWLSDLKRRIKALFGSTGDEDLLCTVYVCKACKLTTTQAYGAMTPLMCGRCGAPFWTRS